MIGRVIIIMKKGIIFIITLVLFIFPSFSYAIDCSSSESTVVYINGIFTSENQARDDLKELKFEYKNKGKIDNIKFINGYNESHLSGAIDLIESVTQAYQGASLDYDLTNILTQIHKELSTRKVLLVGHSQGTFYTNAAYNYLIKNGVPKESIAVYNIATPADKVAGNGNYLTSSTDKVINSIVRELTDKGFAKKPLSANIDITLTKDEENSPIGGHSLSGVYLKNVPDRIIGDMQNEINVLSNSNTSSDNGCFIAPQITLAHKISGLSLLVGDNIPGAVSSKYNTPFIETDLAQKLAKIGSQKVSQALAYIYKFAKIFDISGLFIASLNSSQVGETSNITPTLASSQDTQLPKVQLANNPASVVENNSETINPNNLQDQIDDILEKIDMLKQQIAELTEVKPPQNTLLGINKVMDEKLTVKEIINKPINQENNLPKINSSNGVGGWVGGGGGNPAYPPILISEVQIAGLANLKQEFVELYNPNSQDINLTNWYLQRKTKTGFIYSTYAPNTLFTGKKITANGYFLIAREGSGFSGDIFIDNPLTEDNSLILKNPNGEISDKLGFGQAQDYELLPAQNPAAGQSVGRKIVSGEPTDTNNNSVDFEIDSPTPKAQNIAYVAPLALPVSATPPPLPAPKDTIAPTVVFNLNATQNNLSFAVNFNITDTAVGITPSGVAGYVFRWKEESGAWQEDAYKNIDGAPATFTATKDFTGNDEKNYYFQLKTKDVAGNESDWQPKTPATTKISTPKKVLINEIQIDNIVGKGGTDDDWVELYNPNNVDVSLNGWSLQKHSSDDPCSVNKSFYKKNFDSDAVILSKGFFLVVSTKASDALKAGANMTISWSLTDNNTIYLVRSGDKIISGNDLNIVDKVGFGDKSCFAEISPAPAPPDAKSIERKKLGQDTDNNSQDFKISDTPTPKGTFPKTTIQDATDYSNNPSSNSPGAPVYNLLIKWQSPSQNIDFYQVQYKLNDGNWRDWLAKTTQNQEYFQGVYSLLNDDVYSFRVRAQDKDENLGDWSEEIKIDLTNPVIINEVAYAGTDASPDDQWIELYNRSDKDIDITGWKIVSGTGAGLNRIDTLSISLKGTILSKGYFILERNDDNALSDVLADQLFIGAIGKNYLYLRNSANRYIDEFYIPYNGLDESSFIINGNHYSKERVGPASFGASDKNWKINNPSTGSGQVKKFNGNDRSENQIYGTPGKQNSVYQLYTYYDASFIENTTLKKEFSPYLFSGMNSQVFKGINLTIEPGVVIKFYDSQSNLTINGTLKAIGTDSDKIVFTSFRDDEGKDSNGDGSNSLPAPGNWLSLYFSPESKNSELENVNVRYGGAVLGSSPLGWGNAIWADKSSISLKNSVVERNKNRAIMLTNSNSTIDSVKFLENNNTDWPQNDESKAIFVQGGAPQIKNSYFENNSKGIYISSFYDPINNTNTNATPTIENNNFVKNGEPMYFSSGAYPIFANNKASENNFNAITFAGGILKDINLKLDLPYLIKSILVVPENMTLTLDPGVIIEFKDNWAGLQIDGTLNAVGTPDKPIIFRAYNYDKDWILPGNWLGLRFTKTSKNSDLENINITYGGAFYGNPSNEDFSSAIKVDQSLITLKNSVIQKNANNGIWLVNSPSVIDNVQFLEQKTSTVSLPAKAIYVQGGSPIIKNSNFENNSYGIYIDGWHNPDTGEDVLGTPDYSENNKFLGGEIKDIFPPVLP